MVGYPHLCGKGVRIPSHFEFCHALGRLRRLYNDSLFGVEANIRSVMHMQDVSIVLNIVGYGLVRFKLYRLWVRLVRVFLFLHGL